MKLLMITRKVDKNDHLAGFVYNWVKKLGEKTEKLYVITWQKSQKGNLPENTEIISLSGSKIKKILVLQKKLLKLLPKVDGVFAHMNPEYTILAAPWAKLFRKKIVTWYTHGSVSRRLKLVNLLTDKIVTASEESCRLKNRKKIEVIGHGIDTEKFKPVILSESEESRQKQTFNILSIGRISPTKNYETLIEAIDILANQDVILSEALVVRERQGEAKPASSADKNPVETPLSFPRKRESRSPTDQRDSSFRQAETQNDKNNVIPDSDRESLFHFQIIGAPGLKSQEDYFEKLKNLVKQKQLESHIGFLGAVPHNQILPYLQQADLFINLSGTGSVDKAVLEAMSCKVPVLTSNDAFKNILNDDRLIFEKQNPKDLAQKIQNLAQLDQSQKTQIVEKLRQTVEQKYNLDKLIDKIVSLF